jgi:hypothetical protein
VGKTLISAGPDREPPLKAHCLIDRGEAGRPPFDGGRTVLHGSVGEQTETTSCLCSSDADGLRASEIKHPVQGLNCNGDLSAATSVGPRTQRISNQALLR